MSWCLNVGSLLNSEVCFRSQFNQNLVHCHSLQLPICKFHHSSNHRLFNNHYAFWYSQSVPRTFSKAERRRWESYFRSWASSVQTDLASHATSYYSNSSCSYTSSSQLNHSYHGRTQVTSFAAHLASNIIRHAILSQHTPTSPTNNHNPKPSIP